VPGLKSVDPYDFIVVLADESSKKGAMSDEERAALIVEKVPYDVALEAPPLRVLGRVHLSAGTAPESLLERTAEMFVPVVGGVAYIGDRAVSEPEVDAILVNRFYLRGVKETGQKAASTSATASASTSASTSAATPSATKDPKPASTSVKRAKGGGKGAAGRPKRGGLGPRT
jgi:hypothetical protein